MQLSKWYKEKLNARRDPAQRTTSSHQQKVQTKCRDPQKKGQKGWHDKKMRKKDCDIGDKMLMNNSSKESFKHEEKITTSYLPFITGCHHAPMMKVTS